jgi:phosphatidylethanolamine/phosphatidyl-N-methylethanolamine N-methyltransferase
MDHAFLKHFLRNPKKVGAIVPLSKSVIKELLKHFYQRNRGNAWNILEVGAGTGNITQEILSQMDMDDSLDVVEIDQDCCRILDNRFSRDKRAKIHCLSVIDWTPQKRYDVIISTLPMNSFSPDFVKKIFSHYQQISQESALCSYVEYMGLNTLDWLFAGSAKKHVIEQRRQVIEHFQKKHLIEKSKVFTNFLPCYVYHLHLH